MSHFNALGIDYSQWPTVTQKPIPVAPELIAYCRLPTPSRREEAMKIHGPHTEAAIVVRVNSAGIERFKTGQTVPTGTIVVKEKFSDPLAISPPTAIGVMIKREPGYDPEHGDWEYAYEERSPKTEQTLVRGRLESCIKCHSGARDTDYLFRGYLQEVR